MEYFVEQDSVVREIWGKGDTILFIFAGASAEFALNKAVDWLYFTGKLPADPLKRLFSTITYARQIVFSEEQAALKAIDKITAIHTSVEKNRGTTIPDWAYRDVLFMLIHYSIASFEVMERKLTGMEKENVYHVFHRLGNRMNLKDLPTNYSEWILMREDHLQKNLLKSNYTIDLYRQYKKHLGIIRYKILLEGQVLVVPRIVNELLHLGNISWLTPLLGIYKFTRKLKIDWFFKSIVLPPEYRSQIKELDTLQRKEIRNKE
jgi:ER-bound oxygenase mpaB/B'/Rubber oxygenase, catalytic domain